jgi:hypothetical protein
MVAVEYGFGPQPRNKDQKTDQEDIQAVTFHVHLNIEFQRAIGPEGRKEGFFKIHILTYPLARGKEIVKPGQHFFSCAKEFQARGAPSVGRGLSGRAFYRLDGTGLIL